MSSYRPPEYDNLSDVEKNYYDNYVTMYPSTANRFLRMDPVQRRQLALNWANPTQQSTTSNSMTSYGSYIMPSSGGVSRSTISPLFSSSPTTYHSPPYTSYGTNSSYTTYNVQGISPWNGEGGSRTRKRMKTRRNRKRYNRFKSRSKR
jgi:hypothetical protein